MLGHVCFHSSSDVGRLSFKIGKVLSYRILEQLLHGQ